MNRNFTAVVVGLALGVGCAPQQSSPASGPLAAEAALEADPATVVGDDDGGTCVPGAVRYCYDGPPDAGGVGVCTSGVQVCGPDAGFGAECLGAVLPRPEVCNGADDDCNGVADDGLGDQSCGVGACRTTTPSCLAGVPQTCVPSQPTPDVCDGIDNDCDPASPDGSGDPAVGTRCDGPDSDLCAEGTRACVGGVLMCGDATASTLDVCNGVDDDCDPASADGSEDPALGSSCDGPDSDLCAEGARACVSGALACSDTSGSSVDVCNGVDDDCDASSADGSEDPLAGTSCDGPDSDLCLEGVRACTAGTLVCSDTTASTLDVCNGVDDDCDASSADGSEDARVGLSCDGADSDLCAEGASVCVSGALACSDTSGSSVDVCNGADDDCDASSADGSEDPLAGTSCDGPDSDLCLEGVRACTAGTLVCSDTTSSNVEVCNGVDDDCDGLVDEGGFTLCPFTPNVWATACGGTGGCRIAWCAPFRADRNGVYADGCESLWFSF